jgi:hypothetical protein
MKKAGHTLACLLILGLITLGESRLFDRLLYLAPAEYGFVRQNISGILAGTPIWKAFQQRALGPALVVALDQLTGDPLRSLQIYGQLMAAGANLLLFLIVRWRGGRPIDGVLAVAGFGLARLLLTFKLELPWDGPDLLLFLLFGYWASKDNGKGGSILPLIPLLVAGTFNHETALFIPIWYLLSWLEPPRPSARATLHTLVAPAVILAAMLAVTFAVRAHFYVGPPQLAGQRLEPVTPMLSNPIHLAHNGKQFLRYDWTTLGGVFVSAGLLSLLVVLVVNLVKRRRVRSSVWSLGVIASIFTFGYINETRLYFPLLAFWAASAWPVPIDGSS